LTIHTSSQTLLASAHAHCELPVLTPTVNSQLQILTLGLVLTLSVTISTQAITLTYTQYSFLCVNLTCFICPTKYMEIFSYNEGKNISS